jgi:hypothetical protein
MRVKDQDKSNCDLAYMTSFWRESQLVQSKKKILKKSSWFGESNHKLSSTVAHFFNF